MSLWQSESRQTDLLVFECISICSIVSKKQKKPKYYIQNNLYETVSRKTDRMNVLFLLRKYCVHFIEFCVSALYI